MDGTFYLWALLLLPIAGGLAALAAGSQRTALAIMCGAVFAGAGAAAVCVREVFTAGPIMAAGGWLYLDALSAYHLAVMMAVFGLSSAYAWTYFADEIREGAFSRRQARTFAALWCGAMASMSMVLASNNLGLMWVCIEATTLLTAFLICIHVSRASIEAMWKYILICSIGVAFAFMGTLLTAASGAGGDSTLLWTSLRDKAAAHALDPGLIRAGFLFLLVGYGTKAGLAPMHSWLPDAHSQAPAPVSAIFSGFMLNAALYCVMRNIPVVELATGCQGWALQAVLVFGVVSILVSAAFIVIQRDVKRLLAYHSVEHIGIISLGLGLGGLGAFAALFHTLNHSLCKTLAFFSAGRLGQMYGTHDMEKMAGSMRRSPLWGAGLFGSILALIGVAPFALFMSEFQIAKAAVDGRSFVALALFLAGGAVVFVGALRHAMHVAWDDSPSAVKPVRSGLLEIALVVLPLALLLALGLWMPAPLRTAIEQAAAILNPQAEVAADAVRAAGGMP
jgi:hydrogenase-4 component F